MRASLLAAAAVLAGCAAALALALTDSAAFDPTHGHRLAFGRPFSWLVQDQSEQDPPARWSAAFGSPWEYPTHVSASALVADVVIIAAVVGLLLGGVRWAVRRHRLRAV